MNLLKIPMVAVDMMAPLSHAQKGQIFDAIVSHSEGQQVEVSDDIAILWLPIKSILDKELRRQQDISEKRSKARKGKTKKQKKSTPKTEKSPKKQPAIPNFSEFLAYAKSQEKLIDPRHLEAKYDLWKEAGWKDGHGKPIINWKTKLRMVIPHLKKIRPDQVETGARVAAPKSNASQYDQYKE